MRLSILAPLISEQGELLGINTFVIRESGGGNAVEGCGFAVSEVTIQAAAHKDYVTSSTAGLVTLAVFARQGPGPNQVQSTVSVVTWHGPN